MILAKRDVSWYASFNKKQWGHMLTLKIGMTWSRQDKGQNSQFNINSYYFASLAYMTIVQDMEIVLGYSGYDFHQWDKDGHKKASRWGQIMGFNAPRRSPRRDNRNGHMDRLIQSPAVGVMAPRSAPIWAKPIWPDLGTGLTGFGCCAAQGVRSDRIWWPVWPVLGSFVRIRVIIWF